MWMLISLACMIVMTYNHANAFPIAIPCDQNQGFDALHGVALSNHKCTSRCSVACNKSEDLVLYVHTYDKTLGFEKEGPKSQKKGKRKSKHQSKQHRVFHEAEAKLAKKRKMNPKWYQHQSNDGGDSSDDEKSKWTRLMIICVLN
jgi:hypothetical protein